MIDPRNNLDWLAFRYVAGEMTADEVANFELLLADDQAAREAVASAVDLSQAILAAESLSPTMAEAASVVRRQWSVAAWLVPLGVACALLLLTLSFASREPSQPGVSEEVAAAWMHQLGDPETPADSNTQELDEPESITLTDAEVPGWMFEAVRSLHAREESSGDSAEGMEG